MPVARRSRREATQALFPPGKRLWRLKLKICTQGTNRFPIRAGCGTLNAAASNQRSRRQRLRSKRSESYKSIAERQTHVH